MNWTALVTEYLVIGSQTLVWLSLTGLAITGIPPAMLVTWSQRLPTGAAAVVATLILVAAYSLGILLDTICFNVAKLLLKRRVKRLWASYSAKRRTRTVGGAFLDAEDLIYGDEGQQSRKYRRRGRIRTFRAQALQIPLITFSISLHYLAWWIIVLGLVLEIASICAFLAVHKQYVRMIARKAQTMQNHTAS